MPESHASFNPVLCCAKPKDFQQGIPSETSFGYAFIVTAAYNPRTVSLYI